MLIRVEEIFSVCVEVARTNAGCAAIDISSVSLNPLVPVEGKWIECRDLANLG
jgi:hypothetical protein